MTSPTGANLRGVWVARRGNAYAVGQDGVALYYDGFEWNHILELEALAAALPPPTPDFLAVWGIDEPREVFALSEGKKIFHLSDGVWKDSGVTPTHPLAAIHGSSRNNVYSVGLLGEIWKYDGTQWLLVPPGIGGTSIQLTSVWALDSDLFVAGGAGVPGSGTIFSTICFRRGEQQQATQ